MVDDRLGVIGGQCVSRGLGKQQATTGRVLGAELSEQRIAFVEAHAHVVGVGL